MILEFIQSILSDAPTWAREQGLLKESLAIHSRYLRHKEPWTAHLSHCQSEIETFLNQYPGKKKLGILGSGYLLDFPSKILNDSSYELFLFDAVHPRALKTKTTKAKLNFIYVDLNLAPEILNFDFQQELASCELMLSTNLLSQLALGGSRHLENDENQRIPLARQLVSQHLKFLRSTKKPSILISDFEKIIKSKQGSILVQESSLANFQMPIPAHQWLWPLAPLGEISKDYSIELKVGTWHF